VSAALSPFLSVCEIKRRCVMACVCFFGVFSEGKKGVWGHREIRYRTDR
jgi:hypothetical protein